MADGIDPVEMKKKAAILARKEASLFLQELIMGITKFTLVDSPEKMRPQNTGYSIVFPQLKTSVPHKDHNQDEIQTKSAVIK